MQRRLLAGVLVGVTTLLLAQRSLAAAFFIQEQSIAGMGRAYAGESAVADTPATIFFNPAGLTYLDRPQVHGAGYAILPEASCDDRGTVAATPATFGAFRRVRGNDGGNPYGPTPFGNFYASMPVVGYRAGFTCDLTHSIAATFGYMHAFLKEATFDRARTFYGGTPLATRFRFRADASAMVNIVGAGLTYRF